MALEEFAMAKWLNNSEPVVPATRMMVGNSNLFLWVVGRQKIVVATEHVYSAFHSRFLRLGDAVLSDNKDKGWPGCPRGTPGVIVEIATPFEKGVTDYMYRVVFQFAGMAPIMLKGTHLIWEKSQRIRIGKPAWHNR